MGDQNSSSRHRRRRHHHEHQGGGDSKDHLLALVSRGGSSNSRSNNSRKCDFYCEPKYRGCSFIDDGSYRRKKHAYVTPYAYVAGVNTLTFTYTPSGGGGQNGNIVIAPTGTLTAMQAAFGFTASTALGETVRLSFAITDTTNFPYSKLYEIVALPSTTINAYTLQPLNGRIIKSRCLRPRVGDYIQVLYQPPIPQCIINQQTRASAATLYPNAIMFVISAIGPDGCGNAPIALTSTSVSNVVMCKPRIAKPPPSSSSPCYTDNNYRNDGGGGRRQLTTATATATPTKNKLHHHNDNNDDDDGDDDGDNMCITVQKRRCASGTSSSAELDEWMRDLRLVRSYSAETAYAALSNRMKDRLLSQFDARDQVMAFMGQQQQQTHYSTTAASASAATDPPSQKLNYVHHMSVCQACGTECRGSCGCKSCCPTVRVNDGHEEFCSVIGVSAFYGLVVPSGSTAPVVYEFASLDRTIVTLSPATGYTINDVNLAIGASVMNPPTFGKTLMVSGVVASTQSAFNGYYRILAFNVVQNCYILEQLNLLDSKPFPITVNSVIRVKVGPSMGWYIVTAINSQSSGNLTLAFTNLTDIDQVRWVHLYTTSSSSSSLHGGKKM